jgi:hypothetical protein
VLSTIVSQLPPPPHHHFVVCLATGPYHLPKRILLRKGSSASSLNFKYIFVSLRSSSSCSRLLPRLPGTSIYPFSISPSITCFRRPFLRKMPSIQQSFILFSECMIFLSYLTLCNSSFLTWSVQLISPYFSNTTFQNCPGPPHLLPEVSKFRHHIKLCYKCGTISASHLNSLPQINIFLRRWKQTIIARRRISLA